jgi:hypothetical protein
MHTATAILLEYGIKNALANEIIAYPAQDSSLC